MTPPTGTQEDAARRRKSVEELLDAVERSGERFSSQLDSSILTVAEAGSEVFLATVRLITDLAEASAQRLSDLTLCGRQPAASAMGAAPSETASRSSRIMTAHKDTLSAVIRINNRAVRQALDVAQDSSDRIAEGETRATAST